MKDINIYEWWHDSLPNNTFTVPTSSYELINYVTQYGEVSIGCAGAEYYNRYNNSIYPDYYRSNLNNVINNGSLSDFTRIGSDGTAGVAPTSVWNITHWINSEDLLVQCYTEDFEEIWPKSVTIIDKGSVKVEFADVTYGYCLCIKADFAKLYSGTFWDVTHYINKKTILSQSFSEVKERFSPINIYNKSYDETEITTNESGYGFCLKSDFIYYHMNETTKWDIHHNLNALLITQVYDLDDNLVIPKKISHNDLTYLTIEFARNTKGYVVLKNIGKKILTDDQVYTPGISGSRGIEDETGVIGNPYDNPNYTPKGKILSPYFTVEGDLTCKPIDENQIICADTGKNLIENWELVRPAGKVANYHLVFAPTANFTGNIVGTFGLEHAIYWETVCLWTRVFENITTHNQIIPSTTWTVLHVIKSTDVLVYVFNDDNEQVYPTITIIDAMTITIDFGEELNTGNAIIISADMIEHYFGDSVDIAHEFSYVLSQSFNLSHNENIFPDTIINNEDLLQIRGSADSTVKMLDNNILWQQSTMTDTWSLQHDFQTTGVITEFYTGANERIIPESYTLNSANTCTATFSESVSGFAIMRNVGFIQYIDNISDDLSTNGANIVFGDGTDRYYIDNVKDSVQNEIGRLTVPAEQVTISSNDLLVSIELSKNNLVQLRWIDANGDPKYDITEIGIYNSGFTRMYFYSQGSVLSKPDNCTMTIFFKITKT